MREGLIHDRWCYNRSILATTHTTHRISKTGENFTHTCALLYAIRGSIAFGDKSLVVSAELKPVSTQTEAPSDYRPDNHRRGPRELHRGQS